MAYRKTSQKIFDALFSLLPIPLEMEGEAIKRVEPCRFCSSTEGRKIAVVNYWDLKQTNLVQCSDCNLIQLDPMLTLQETDTGCLAYHIQESLGVPCSEQSRNMFSNFRKGVFFANNLKKLGIKPKDILEFGPGTGYFTCGIQYVFPQVNVTVVDIVEDVLQKTKENHGFSTVLGTPEHSSVPEGKKFDLIIARDVMEHVVDISVMIKNVVNYLSNGGYFHFLTPNGHEDAWRFYSRYRLSNNPSDLRINHVNYFDGMALKSFLEKNGLTSVEYFTFRIKNTLKGKGWKINERNAAPISQEVSAEGVINQQRKDLESLLFRKEEILNKWFLRGNYPKITSGYCWYKNHTFLKISPELNIGHEIHGLFVKTQEV